MFELKSATVSHVKIWISDFLHCLHFVYWYMYRWAEWDWQVLTIKLVSRTAAVGGQHWTQLLYLWAILPTCFVFSKKAKSEYHSKYFLLLHCTGCNISSFQSYSWNLLHCKASMSCVIHTGGSSTLIRHVSNMNIFLKLNGWIYFFCNCISRNECHQWKVFSGGASHMLKHIKLSKLLVKQVVLHCNVFGGLVLLDLQRL